MQGKKIHYAWFTLIGSMITVFCCIGLGANAFTAFQPYIISRNGFTNAQSSMILTVRSLFAFLGMLFNGFYYKKISYRNGMALACLTAAVAFVLFGFAKSYASYLAAAALLGCGYGLGSMIPCAIVIGNWFQKKRTLALSLCIAVTGLSTFGIPTLITNTIESHGLPTAFWGTSAATVVLGILCWILVRDVPEDKGLTAYGSDDPAVRESFAHKTGVMDRTGWIVMAPVMFFSGIISTTSFVHLTVHAVSSGYTTQTAALGMTVVGIALTVGKLFFGTYAEKTSTYRANWVNGFFLVAGALLCCLFNGNKFLFYAGIGIYGLGFALPTVGCSAWASDLSSTDQYAANVRRFNTLNGAGNLVFSSIPGIIADRNGGSYKPAYMIFAVMSILLVAGVQFTYRRLIRKQKSEQSKN